MAIETPPTGFPRDILTNQRYGIRRLAVDPQQTSFEDNTQFRYFDEYNTIASTDQIVYLVTVGENPVNLFRRELSLSSGGRKYRAYMYDNGETFTGTLADSGLVSGINSNLNPHITTHPATDATIQRSVGSSIFSAGTNKPFTGTSVLVGGSTAQKSSEYSPHDIRLGVAKNTQFWLVLDDISNNEDTEGEFEFIWEERFGE